MWCTCIGGPASEVAAAFLTYALLNLRHTGKGVVGCLDKPLPWLSAVLAIWVSAGVEILGDTVLIASIRLRLAPVFRTFAAIFAFVFSHRSGESDSPRTTR